MMPLALHTSFWAALTVTARYSARVPVVSLFFTHRAACVSPCSATSHTLPVHCSASQRKAQKAAAAAAAAVAALYDEPRRSSRIKTVQEISEIEAAAAAITKSMSTDVRHCHLHVRPNDFARDLC
jgi:hypothetical protein